MSDAIAALPDRLRRARRLAGLSQRALGARIGITASAVAQWERASGTEPSVANLARVALATGVDGTWLLTGSGAPTRALAASTLEMDEFARDAAEAQLLRAYRRLKVPVRRQLVELVRALSG